MIPHCVISKMRVCVSVECGASKQRHTLSMSQPSKSSIAESASITTMITLVNGVVGLDIHTDVELMASVAMVKGKSNEIRNN